MESKSIISIIRASFYHWQSHRASRMGAAISFYTIFSVVPLLMLALYMIGPILGNEYLQNVIVGEAGTLINIKSANLIQSILISLSQVKYSFIVVLISIGTLAFGALGVFYELKNSLDDLWDTKQLVREVRSWKYFFSSRIVSLSVIPILGLLLIFSIIISSLFNLAISYSPAFSKITLLFQLTSFTTSFLILCFLFTFIFRFLPKRRLPWRELINGAIVTSVLFMLGKFILGFWITELAGASIFGATEASIVILLWVYYSAQIFLFGASLTYIYSKKYGYLKED